MSSTIVPIPEVPVSVRVATLADVPFMDSLQKRHGKALGHFTFKQFEGYVEMGAVLVAEGPLPNPLPGGEGARLGYIIHRDRYLKRDELGVIFQLCVAEGEQRKLVGARLVREAFARSAYGCRLYCLWCAQDLDANYFWESLGFVPIAFRAGSARKRRVHIFWQKRIREGDTEPGGAKWWYPCQTSGGAIGDDRLVFPIPPGKHWRDEMPVILPRITGLQPVLAGSEGRHGLKTRDTKKAIPAGSVKLRQFGGPSNEPIVPTAAPVAEKPKREKKPKVKCDPKHVALARELRDRWSEHVSSGAMLIEGGGKYDVAREALPAPIQPAKLLAA
jgi:hypothetical protein